MGDICFKEIFNYISNDETILEQEPLKKLAEDGQLNSKA